MKNLATLILALAIPVMAQTVTPATPTFTKTELLAIKQIQQEFSQANQLQQQATADLRSFSQDVAANHPGYVLDPASGTLIAAPKKTEAKPLLPPTEKK